MNTTHPVAGKILARLSKNPGVPLSIPDLLDLAARPAINQALARLTKAGKIQRIRRGLYAQPYYSTLLKTTVPPSVEAMAQAWARQNGLRVIPFGAYAANLLGLSTQVPAQYVYYTNGRTQQVRLGTSNVRFLNRGPKTMDVQGAMAAHIFQALRHLGRTRVGEAEIARLRRLLRPKDRADLKRSLKYAAGWMRPVIEQLVSEGPR